ncbi:MAG: hypothetical protein ACRD5E_08775 [Nitrososphaeraceae archaeon]
MNSIPPDQDDIYAGIKNHVWKRLVKYYEFVQGAQLSNSFIILMALNETKQPLSTTQISEMIAIKTNARIFKVSGALKDSLEKRLRRQGYVEGKDILNINVQHKRVKMTLYSITPKGKKLLQGWLGFLSSID